MSDFIPLFNDADVLSRKVRPDGQILQVYSTSLNEDTAKDIAMDKAEEFIPREEQSIEDTTKLPGGIFFGQWIFTISDQA